MVCASLVFIGLIKRVVGESIVLQLTPPRCSSSGTPFDCCFLLSVTLSINRLWGYGNQALFSQNQGAKLIIYQALLCL